MSNASPVAPNSLRPPAAAIIAVVVVVVVGALLPACGSVRGTGKPLLEPSDDSRDESVESAPASGSRADSDAA